MIDLTDIQSLSEFQRRTKEHLKTMQRTGRPKVLTVNGRAALVVQDAKAYQKLLDLVEQAETMLTLRRRLDATRSGTSGRPLEDAIESLGRRTSKAARKA